MNRQLVEKKRGWVTILTIINIVTLAT